MIDLEECQGYCGYGKELRELNAKLLEALERISKGFRDEYVCDESHSHNKVTIEMAEAAIAAAKVKL